MTTLDPDHLIINRIFNLVEHFKQGGKAKMSTKLVCNKCQNDFYTASPQVFVGEIHKGCGGRYEIADEKENDL